MNNVLRGLAVILAFPLGLVAAYAPDPFVKVVCWLGVVVLLIFALIGYKPDSEDPEQDRVDRQQEAKDRRLTKQAPPAEPELSPDFKKALDAMDIESRRSIAQCMRWLEARQTDPALTYAEFIVREGAK